VLCRAATFNQIHVHSCSTHAQKFVVRVRVGVDRFIDNHVLPITNAIYCYDTYAEVIIITLLLFCVGLMVVESTLPLIHASKHIDPIGIEGDIR
jgi:hypothetical protein